MMESARIMDDAAKARSIHYFTHVCSRCGAEAFSQTTIQPIGWEMRGLTLTDPVCPDCARTSKAGFHSPVDKAAMPESPPAVFVGDSGGPNLGNPARLSPASANPPQAFAVNCDGQWLIQIVWDAITLNMPVSDFAAMCAAGSKAMGGMSRDWEGDSFPGKGKIR